MRYNRRAGVEGAWSPHKESALSTPKDTHDHRQRRCPRLGHQVSFAYCRAPGSDRPCGKITDCWWEQFDVVGFLRDAYGRRMLEELATPRPDKLATLVDLIRRAQQVRDGGDDPS